MSVNPRRKTYGRADRRALITEHAVGDGLGCTLNATAFATAAGVADNLVPALYPVSVDADGRAWPFTAAGQTATATTPARPFSGFTVNPVDVTHGDDVTGYIWHGTIDPALLPVAFDPAGVTTGNIGKFTFGKA